MVYFILFSSYMIYNMHRGAGVICVNNTEAAKAGPRLSFSLAVLTSLAMRVSS